MVYSNEAFEAFATTSLRSKGREVNAACKCIHAITKHSGAWENFWMRAALPRTTNEGSLPLFAK